LRGESFERFIFLHNIKSFSFEKTQKLYWRSVLGDLGGLYEFFKFNLYCYNILKILNTLIININLSLSKKIFSKNVTNFSIFLTLQTLPFPPLPPNAQTKPKRNEKPV